MSIVRAHFSTTLDSYAAGADQRLEAPFGGIDEAPLDFEVANVQQTPSDTLPLRKWRSSHG